MRGSHARRPHVRARALTTMALLEYFKREDAQYAGCRIHMERSPKRSPIAVPRSTSRQQRQKDLEGCRAL